MHACPSQRWRSGPARCVGLLNPCPPDEGPPQAVRLHISTWCGFGTPSSLARLSSSRTLPHLPTFIASSPHRHLSLARSSSSSGNSSGDCGSWTRSRSGPGERRRQVCARLGYIPTGARMQPTVSPRLSLTAVARPGVRQCCACAASSQQRQVSEQAGRDKVAWELRAAQLAEREAELGALELKLHAERKALAGRERALDTEQAATAEAAGELERAAAEVTRQRQSRRVSCG